MAPYSNIEQPETQPLDRNNSCDEAHDGTDWAVANNRDSIMMSPVAHHGNAGKVAIHSPTSVMFPFDSCPLETDSPTTSTEADMRSLCVPFDDGSVASVDLMEDDGHSYDVNSFEDEEGDMSYDEFDSSPWPGTEEEHDNNDSSDNNSDDEEHLQHSSDHAPQCRFRYVLQDAKPSSTVQFTPIVEVVDIPHWSSFTKREIRDAWYTPNDFDRMKRDRRRAFRRHHEGIEPHHRDTSSINAPTSAHGNGHRLIHPNMDVKGAEAPSGQLDASLQTPRRPMLWRSLQQWWGRPHDGQCHSDDATANRHRGASTEFDDLGSHDDCDDGLDLDLDADDEPLQLTDGFVAKVADQDSRKSKPFHLAAFESFLYASQQTSNNEGPMDEHKSSDAGHDSDNASAGRSRQATGWLSRFHVHEYTGEIVLRKQWVPHIVREEQWYQQQQSPPIHDPYMIADLYAEQSSPCVWFALQRACRLAKQLEEEDGDEEDGVDSDDEQSMISVDFENEADNRASADSTINGVKRTGEHVRGWGLMKLMWVKSGDKQPQ